MLTPEQIEEILEEMRRIPTMTEEELEELEKRDLARMRENNRKRYEERLKRANSCQCANNESSSQK